jgi:ribosomal protein L10
LSISKEEKQAQVEDLHKKFKIAKVSILTHYSGLNVTEMTKLRHQLRSVSAELCVVKNTLAVRAAEGTPLDHVRPAFQGPVAVAMGYADPVAPVRIVKEFSDKNERLLIKMGVVEGRVMDLKNIKFIAQLPEKEVLMAKVITQMQAPLAGLSSVLHGVLYQIVGTIEAIKDKMSSATTA